MYGVGRRSSTVCRVGRRSITMCGLGRRSSIVCGVEKGLILCIGRRLSTVCGERDEGERSRTYNRNL